MARSFDGSTSSISATITAMDTGDWAVAGWIYANSTGQSATGTVFATAFSRQEVRFTSGHLRVQQFFATGANAEADSNDFNGLSAWQYIVATYTDSDEKCRFYRGDLSTPVAETSYTSQVAGGSGRSSGATSAAIGNRTAGGGSWDGKISRLLVTARLLSLAEMEALRLGWMPLLDSSARGYWPLDSPTASKVDDLFGLANGTDSGTSVTEDPPVPPRQPGGALAPVLVAAAAPQIVDVGQAVETDAAGAVTPSRVVDVGQAMEADVANAVTPTRTHVVGQAIETDVANAVTPRLVPSIAGAVVTDVARGVAISLGSRAAVAFLPAGIARPGQFRLFVAERGGEVLLDELSPTALTFGRRLNQLAQANATLTAGSSTVLGGLRSYAHELIVVRDKEVVWVGPIVKPKWTTGDVTLPAPDVGLGWLAVRDVVRDQRYANHDVSDIARRLVNETLAVENSMDLQVTHHVQGFAAAEQFQRSQHQKVADALNSLVSKGLQYTTHVRRLLLGPILEDPLVFADDSFVQPDVAEGDAASRVTVVGAQTVGVNRPVEGAAGGTTTGLGLVERTINDQRVTNEFTALVAADVAHRASHPPPLVVSGVLKPAAVDDFNRLICGRSAVVKLNSLDRVVDARLTLLQVDVNVQAGDGNVSIVLGAM